MLLGGCGSKGTTENNKDQTADTSDDHPVITMNAPYRNMSTFVDKVNEKYPEINLEVIPYNGQNTSAYMMAMRSTGNMTDIYFTTYYAPGKYDEYVAVNTVQLINTTIRLVLVFAAALVCVSIVAIFLFMRASMSEAPVEFYVMSTPEEAAVWMMQEQTDLILLSGCMQNRDLRQTVDMLKTKAENVSILKGMKFLCAEDNELNAKILSEILSMYNAKCTIYSNGEQIVQAFEKINPGEYDAILMAIQMPKMNGIEAAKFIRSGRNPLGKTIPIIAMTANAFSEDVQQCMEAGMDAHIAKPLDITILEKTMRTLSVGGQSLWNHK